MSTVGNERGVNPLPFSVTASSELDATHTQAYSRLYGIKSWCSKVVSPPQYLQFDFWKVITVSGIATQGDNVVDKWVTSYGISYGYDGWSWISYNGGQVNLHVHVCKRQSLIPNTKTIAIFRWEDEYNYEYKFSILSPLRKMSAPSLMRKLSTGNSYLKLSSSFDLKVLNGLVWLLLT